MILVVMGVAGSGKTTVARTLAERLGWRFQEGDALHPPANVAKMSAGTPLTDDDNYDWQAFLDGNSGTANDPNVGRNISEVA